ncbi:hypothetical protein PFISCL1PPCAC_29220, partial [Pristionchus fissidentatus]
MVLRFPILLLTLTTVMPIDFRKCGWRSYCEVHYDCFSPPAPDTTGLYPLHSPWQPTFDEKLCKVAAMATPLSMVEWEFEMLGNVWSSHAEFPKIVKCELGKVTKHSDYTTVILEEIPSNYCRVQIKRSDEKPLDQSFPDALADIMDAFAKLTSSPLLLTPIDFECEDEIACESPIHDQTNWKHLWKCEQDDFYISGTEHMEWQKVDKMESYLGKANSVSGTGAMTTITESTLMMCRRDRTTLCDETVL